VGLNGSVELAPGIVPAAHQGENGAVGSERDERCLARATPVSLAPEPPLDGALSRFL
jgi:hypothetical protein